MKKYIFLSTLGYSMAPDGRECINCQELGVSFGNTPQEAWKGLLKDESFITEHGYDQEGVFCYEIKERHVIFH